LWFVERQVVVRRTSSCGSSNVKKWLAAGEVLIGAAAPTTRNQYIKFEEPKPQVRGTKTSSSRNQNLKFDEGEGCLVVSEFGRLAACGRLVSRD
jgi:hypothetical protein